MAVLPRSMRNRRRTVTIAAVPLQVEPPAARIAVNGARPVSAVMRGEWIDPTDIKPTAARTAKRINGWRSFDPLRKALNVANSGITVEHVMAADMPA